MSTATITTTGTRTDLTGHTITIETLDHDTARKVGNPDAAGLLAAVGRTDGQINGICIVTASLDQAMTERTAQDLADTYGATYVPTATISQTTEDTTTISQQTADAIIARLLERINLTAVEGTLAELDADEQDDVVAAVLRHRSR